MHTSPDQLLSFLQGGGELGALIREKDWSSTPLGPAETWPQSLKTSLGILLNSRYPMFVFWGPHLIKIYNDGYRPITGHKHPWALGRPGPEVWPEIWSDIKPLVERAVSGDPTWSDDLMLFMERNGFPEEVYFTFSYSPIPDESGGVGGMFCACTETTGKVLGERRLRTLRDLAAAPAEARTVAEACALSAEVLSTNRADVPFALVYLATDAAAARLVAQTGVPAGDVLAPLEISGDRVDAAWPALMVAETRAPQHIAPLAGRFDAVPAGPWPEPPSAAMVLPLIDRGLERGIGVIVLGISSRRPFDEEYRGWFALVAGQVSSSISNARAVEEERKRAEALADIDRAKTAFFSNVSHEFRTPLTLMLGPTEDALRSPDQTLRGEDLKVVHRNELRLLKLVNSLLDFSRIEAGRVEATYEPTDLAALTSDLASVFRSIIERAGLRLVVNCVPLDESVYVDREMWEEIVFNLLSNAFKFTFTGEIEVALWAMPRQPGAGHGAVELKVRDTGTGIPADEIPHLFERFHRVRNTRARSFEGSGIGLALVQELAKLHGGTVSVESEVDQGTTFTVSIPLGTAHLRADRIGAPRARASARSNENTYVHEALQWLPAEKAQHESTALPGAHDRAASTARLPHILLVDDNADMREYGRRLLGPRYDVETVADGLTALHVARERVPDLVLADVMMPGLDGFGLLRELRADPRTATIPVILLSARAGDEAQVEGLNAGADDYLIKPFSARELLARVDAHLRLQRQRRDAQAALRQSEEQLRLVTDALPALISYVDSGRRYRFNNRAYTDWFGHTPADLYGKHLEEVLGPEAYEAVRPSVDEVLSGQNVSFEATLNYKDGGGRYVHVNYVPHVGARGEIRGYFTLITDLSERKRAEDALREADRRKDEFLALLAHELRNPLAPIRSAAEVLKMIGPVDSKQRWAREVIERQTQHLTRLVDDLLDVSRITRGKVTLRREPLDLAAVVQRAVETSRPFIDARSHELIVTLPAVPLRIDGDLTRLVQVVGNLLNNAAKYTEEGGHIWLDVAEQGGEAVITVRDDGIGLASDLLPHVFDLFTQADRSLDRSQGGLGIGLTLVRQLVELHGGAVRAHSEGPGHGSEFVVRLPARAATMPTAEESRDERATAASAGLRVLIVEDHLDSAEMMSFLLTVEGHEVRTADDGASALDTARAFQPHVILCDIGLPRMDGYEVAKQLREQPEFKHTRLIALSGYGQAEDRRRSKGAGFDYHLTKPVEPNALATLLRSLRQTDAERDVTGD